MYMRCQAVVATYNRTHNMYTDHSTLLQNKCHNLLNSHNA